SASPKRSTPPLSPRGIRSSSLRHSPPGDDTVSSPAGATAAVDPPLAAAASSLATPGACVTGFSPLPNSAFRGTADRLLPSAGDPLPAAAATYPSAFRRSPSARFPWKDNDAAAAPLPPPPPPFDNPLF
ncbi:unnamed protein product, partial [Ectocarpus fasciculatus]